MRLLISLGPLRAYIDDVRFITNRSTGTFGYKLVKEALLRKHQVKAVVGVTNFLRPSGIDEWIEVGEYHELKRAMERNFAWADVVIMAAAVPDFIPEKRREGKIPRERGGLTLKLKATESIIGALAKRRDRKGKILVGVSLEDEDVIQRAYEKLIKNNLDLMVAVGLKNAGPPFGSNAVSVALVEKDKVERLPIWRKYKIAEYLLNKIESIRARSLP